MSEADNAALRTESSNSARLLLERDEEIKRLNHYLLTKSVEHFADGHRNLVEQIKVFHPNFDFSPFGMCK